MGIFCQHLHIHCSIKFHCFLYKAAALWVFMTLNVGPDPIHWLALKNSVTCSSRADAEGVVLQRSHTFCVKFLWLYFLSKSHNISLVQVHRSESACATVLQSHFPLCNSAVSPEGTAYSSSWKWWSANKFCTDRMFIFMLQPCLLSFFKSLYQMNQTEIRMNKTTWKLL